uniref:Ovule protein n=1 Tax=Parastrongyloides trichosuri TaxID=131310 RepID=A0A0N4ZZM9_PARTI
MRNNFKEKYGEEYEVLFVPFVVDMAKKGKKKNTKTQGLSKKTNTSKVSKKGPVAKCVAKNLVAGSDQNILEGFKPTRLSKVRFDVVRFIDSLTKAAVTVVHIVSDVRNRLKAVAKALESNNGY